MLMIFNKIDLLPETKYLFMKKKLRMDFPNSVFVSAKSGRNLNKIEEYIHKILQKNKRVVNLKIPHKDQKFISFLYNNSEILEKRYNNKFCRMKVRLAYKIFARRFKKLRKYEFKTKRMAKRRKILN